MVAAAAAAAAWTTGSTAVVPVPWAAGSWTWLAELHSSFLKDSAALELAVAVAVAALELAADNCSLLTSFRSVAGEQEQVQVVERQEPGVQTGQTLQMDQKTLYCSERNGLDGLDSALFMSVTQVLQRVSAS